MKTKNAVRIISFCVAAVLASVGFIIKEKQLVNRYKLQIQNTYSNSLDELNSSVNNIALILEKAQYVTSARQISTMATKLVSQSETAKTALSRLPANMEELTVLNRFLSQVGNYATSVSNNLTDGNKISEDYDENITLLGDTATKISEVISDLQISYNNIDYWAEELDRELGEVVAQNTLAGSLGELEENLTDYPTLVYDGPYSDHILDKESVMIKDAPKITESEAMDIAANAVEASKDTLNRDGLVSGKIPTYRFSNKDVSIAVSQNGGYVVYMRKSRTVGDTVLEYNQALNKAKRYLEKNGKTSLVETYYFADEGVCVINFAYLDGETVCYTDLIKVGVAMDTGEIMLYEASGYLTNHTDRAFQTPAVSMEEASKAVSSKLSVREMSLALIPTDSGGEVRCYEFVCRSENGKDILVYINAVNLAEERILILLKSDGGILTK